MHAIPNFRAARDLPDAAPVPIDFVTASADVCSFLSQAFADDLDALKFGVIGFDSGGVVRRYNAHESQLAGLSPNRVVGYPLFTIVAPCMNNFMVAQRFEDAAHSGELLDDTINYVLTLRMQPLKVKLRLLADPTMPMRYVMVQRQT